MAKFCILISGVIHQVPQSPSYPYRGPSYRFYDHRKLSKSGCQYIEAGLGNQNITIMTNQLDPQKNTKFKCKNRRFDPDRRTLLNVGIGADDESERLDHGMSERVCRRIDRRAIFWVHYSEIVFTLIVLILIFSLLDAFFTLVLIDYGATELNPLMSFYLNIGPTTFISVKYGMTSLSIFVLLVCSHKPTKNLKIKTQSLFFTILLVVAGVISWQLYLICLNVF